MKLQNGVINNQGNNAITLMGERMKGANEYYELFRKTEQVGKLYLVRSSHARGPTFHIYILPEGEEAIPNGDCNAPLNKDKIEVFGVISGNPGWTESYGWTKEGKWQDDFYALVKERKAERDKSNKIAKEAKQKKENEEETRVNSLLSNY